MVPCLGGWSEGGTYLLAIISCFFFFFFWCSFLCNAFPLFAFFWCRVMTFSAMFACGIICHALFIMVGAITSAAQLVFFLAAVGKMFEWEAFVTLLYFRFVSLPVLLYHFRLYYKVKHPEAIVLCWCRHFRWSQC